MKLAIGLRLRGAHGVFVGTLGLVLAVATGPALAASAPPASPATAAPSQAPSAAPSAAATTAASPAPSASPSASWLASPEPESAPFSPGGGTDVPIIPYLLQLLVVTGVVGALGYFSLQYVQKKMPGLAIGQVTGKQIRLVEKLTIDPKRMVFMVNVGDRYWLCAATEDSVTTIAELTKDDLGGQFAQLLEQEKQRGDHP